MIYNGTRYFYVRNAQGDVVGLTNNTGTSVVSYTYDAWGKILTVSGSKATTIGKYNPLRYRGYVYDTETGLYYLGSRYYDPGVGRFINSDEFVTTQQGFSGLCLFAYCNNNPINNLDLQGYWTYGIIVALNAVFFQGVSVSIGVFIDDDGNFDIQASYAFPFNSETSVRGIPSLGVGVSAQFTNADTVHDLCGASLLTGGSVSIFGVTYGIDSVFLDDWDDPQKSPDGYQFTCGLGLGLVEYHVMKTNTVSVKKFVESIINIMFKRNPLIMPKKHPQKKDRKVEAIY